MPSLQAGRECIRAGQPVLDGNGILIHDRGVTKRAGLYFLGLMRLHSIGSALVAGAVNDARFEPATFGL